MRLALLVGIISFIPILFLILDPLEVIRDLIWYGIAISGLAALVLVRACFGLCHKDTNRAQWKSIAVDAIVIIMIGLLTIAGGLWSRV